MRTTIDIPEGLLRRARARAALEGLRMKDIVNEALRRFLGPGPEEAWGNASDLPERIKREHLGRFCLPVIRSAHPGASAVTPATLKETELDEDEERHGATFGR